MEILQTLALALGLVLIVEGLAYALAPSLVEQLLAQLRLLSEEQRRLLGLAGLALGLVLVWASRGLAI